MARYYIFLVFLISVLSFSQVLTSESLPVIFWNIDGHKTVPALQHIGKKAFKEIAQSYIKDDSFVVVFEDENLSTEDFTNRDTSGRNIFESLERVIDENRKSKLLYLPSVQSPKHVLENLAKTKTSTSLTASAVRSGASKLPKPAADHFTFIRLDEANDNEDRHHLLKRHVKFMTEVFQKLQNQYTNTIAIYTAQHPSWYAPNVGLSRKSRHLMAAEDDKTSQNFNNKNMRIYIGDTPYVNKDKNKVLLDKIDFSTQGNATNIQLKLSQADKPSISLSFVNAAGYWTLTSASVDSDTFKVKEVAAPLDFSYHCSELRISNKNATLVLPRVQFQPNFDEKMQPSAFGDAYDCVGFTSIPIWSGLFITLILAMIMTLGLTMMMDIKTMDRFDDPKGKGVTINVVE